MVTGFVTLLPIRIEKISANWAKRFIRDAIWASPIIAVLCSTWCVMNWIYAPPGMRAYYPLILIMGSLSTAYCLSSIRAAAILNLSIGLVPISLLMLFSGSLMDMVAACCILLAAAFLLQMIFDQEKQWINLLILQHEIQVQADTDPLTDLFNRRALIRKMQQHMDELPDQPFMLALLDLDGFKPVNDRHGHSAGDALLCSISDRLIHAVGTNAVVARIGGDEFAVMLPIQTALDADAHLSALLLSLVPPFSIAQQSIQIGASAGYALWPQDGANIRALFETADQAMYAVKKKNMKAPKTRQKSNQAA
jgi:diguanylate cyclase